MVQGNKILGDHVFEPEKKPVLVEGFDKRRHFAIALFFLFDDGVDRCRPRPVTDIAADFSERNASRVFFFLKHQIEMGLELLLAPGITLVPAVEHLADGGVPGIARHPDLAIVVFVFQMLPVQIEVFAFARLVGVLVNGVFIVADIFARFAT